MNQKTLNIVIIVALAIILSMQILLFVDRERGQRDIKRRGFNPLQNENIDNKTIDDQNKVDQSNETKAPKDDVNQNLLQYSNKEKRFSFKYPSTWKLTENESSGSTYRVLTRVVNPLYAGKPDTDVPVEQFLVRVQEIKCSGDPIVIDGRTGTDKAWYKGFGNNYYRELCFQGHDWPLTITLSAHDETSESTLDQILSSFKFE